MLRTDGNGAGIIDHQKVITVVFLSALAVFSFLYALGEYTPFFDLVWRSFPLIQRFRWPPKILICAVLALSCLAGICFDAIARNPLSKNRSTAGGGVLLRWAAIVAALLCAGFTFAAIAREGTLGKYLLTRFFNIGSVEKIFTHRIPWDSLTIDAVKFAALVVLGTALVVLRTSAHRAREIAAGALILLSLIDLAVADYPLLPAGRKELLDKKPAFADTLCPPGRDIRFYEPREKWILVYGERNEELFEMARDFMLAQWPLAAGTRNAALQGNFKLKDGYDLQTIIEGPGTAAGIKKNLLGMMNCGNYVSFPNLLYLYAFKTLTPGKNARIEPVLPRAFVAGGVTVLDNRQELLNALATASVDFLSVALTGAGDAEGDTFFDLNPGQVTHTVTRTYDGLHRVLLDVESLVAGILVVTDTFYPGWTACVNGRKEKIYKINGAFRGVRIPAGRSTVVMEYRPAFFRAGAAVSLGTALILAFRAAAVLIRGRKKRLHRAQ